MAGDFVAIDTDSSSTNNSDTLVVPDDTSTDDTSGSGDTTDSSSDSDTSGKSLVERISIFKKRYIKMLNRSNAYYTVSGISKSEVKKGGKVTNSSGSTIGYSNTGGFSLGEYTKDDDGNVNGVKSEGTAIVLGINITGGYEKRDDKLDIEIDYLGNLLKSEEA